MTNNVLCSIAIGETMRHVMSAMKDNDQFQAGSMIIWKITQCIVRAVIAMNDR